MTKVTRPAVTVAGLAEQLRVKALENAKINPPEAETPRDLEVKVNEIAERATLEGLRSQGDRAKQQAKMMGKIQKEAEKEIKRGEADVKRYELAVKTFPDNNELATRLGVARREVKRQRAIWGKAGQAVHEWEVFQERIKEELGSLKVRA